MPISYSPSPGLCYNPNDPAYWDEKGLAQELERVFEVCHGCRMCFKYCDTFPDLFKLLDNKYDGDVTKLTTDDQEAVLDTCFQCKLCDVQCPYTPRDNHQYQLDFPKLVSRQRAIRTRKEGVPIRDRILSDPDASGKVARASFGLANVMNRTSAHRWMMEKLLGIHRDKLLPEFAAQTFTKWAEATGRIKDGNAPGADDGTAPGADDAAPPPASDDPAASPEAVLFPTCYVENNEPQVGRDTVEVLEKSKVDLKCTKGLNCCGMPAWEKGDLDRLRAHAKQNLDVLSPYVEAGAKVVVINPTCSLMFRREYAELVPPEDKERAEKLAAATRDASEFLWDLRKEERFNTDFKSTPGEGVAYHAPCHLRAQAIGFRGRDLLKKVPGVKPKMVMECCGHDGTYAMTTEGFEPSQRVGKKSFDGMKGAKTEVWATDCPLAAIQFEQHAGVKPMHPMSILAKAYRTDGFEQKVPTSDDDHHHGHNDGATEK